MAKMVKCLSQPERFEDICERSGLDSNIVERVLRAQKESERDSLRRGERVVNYGLYSMTPHLVNKLGMLGVPVKEVRIDCKVSPSLVDFLNEVDNYKISTETEFDTLVVKTLPFLE